ncbi:MAG: AMP-binding protein [Vicinamibacteria bacterium]
MANIPMEPMIVDWLFHHARTRSDYIACIDLGTGRRFSYSQFFDRVTRLAGALRSRYGVKHGDRVMVVARNSTDIYEIMFAAWRLGAVFMPINWRLATPELEEIARDGDPGLIIADEEFTPGLPTGAIRVLARKPGDATSEYEREISAGPPVLDFAAVDFDTMNTLLYTSGTTGKPKGVIGTWRMTTVMQLQAGVSAELTPHCVTLTAAPQFHTAGLNSFATSLFHLGGTLAVMSTWDAEKSLRHLADPALGVTHTLGVPTQYLLMSRLPSFATARFPTLQMAAVGGAPPSQALLEACAAQGLPLTPGYGMTEVFGVTQMRADVALRKPGAVGWPAIYTEFRVADDAGRVLPPGEVGEIQIRSAGVTPGYWRQPEATAEAFIDGWFRSGDLGYLDESGLLYLVDRKKDMYISGGENVYPAEVENLMSGFPEVSQVAVIGVPNLKWGEVGLAVIVLRPGAAASEIDLIERCRGRIAAFKIPKAVAFVNALPMSAQGKVQKNELRRQHGR